MSALLLDTHAYVWALTAPERLSPRAREAIGTATNEVLVSAVSTWEMAIKHRAGKWPEAELLLQQHVDLTDRLGARRLDITSAAALRAGGLAWKHADPFDRMLAAQAMILDATLVSRDTAFDELPGLQLMW